MGKDFVLYRLPYNDVVNFHNLTGENTKGAKFVFQSFDSTKREFYGMSNSKSLSITELVDFELHLDLPSYQGIKKSISKAVYLQKCERFIEALKKAKYDKLILSRIKWMPPFENVKQKFIKLCNKYPSAFVYLASFDEQVWMGASPEKLVEVDGNVLQTVALAGTKAVSDQRDWTQKEYHEHQIVVDYIAENISDLNPKINATETIDLGDIQHLQTKISADLVNEISVTEICNRLHPTPAVCGMPKEEAKKFILENEGYDRSFYTGYFGIVQPEKSEIYVNLRCAQLYADKTAVYVGGGLLAESDPEAEWQETEWKAKALF